LPQFYMYNDGYNYVAMWYVYGIQLFYFCILYNYIITYIGLHAYCTIRTIWNTIYYCSWYVVLWMPLSQYLYRKDCSLETKRGNINNHLCIIAMYIVWLKVRWAKFDESASRFKMYIRIWLILFDGI